MKTFVSIFFLSLSTFAHADVISLRTDLWCPYACDPKSDKPGFMIEIAKEVFSKHGHTIDYKVMNWSRAIADVKVGKVDALVGASRGDVHGFVIPTVATGSSTNYFWTLDKSNWSYTDETSLLNKKIGVINAYSYGEEIDKLIRNKHKSFIKVAGENPLLRMIQMMESNRLDSFVENPSVLYYTLSKIDKNKSLFKMVSKNISEDPELFIAFSPASIKSQVYSQQLDEGMQELRKSGRLNVILKKYGLSDWKK